jgi:hypothetical protein
MRDEPLEIESSFALGGTGEIPFNFVGEIEDWEVILPSTSDKVCSSYGDHVFPMYEVVFKDMDFCLPFSDFQRDVLRWTKLSPSQIQHNSYAFMRAFELVCQYLGVPASKNVFFSIFTVQQGTAWVSFRQNKKMFDIFAGKVRSFKERFFLVKLRSELALDTLLQTAEGESPDRRPFFPLCWSRDHFRYESKDFCRSVSSLTEEEKEVHRKLRASVQSFPRGIKTDKRGNLVMDAEGKSVTEPRFINTHELVVSKDPDGCLGSYISFSSFSF